MIPVRTSQTNRVFIDSSILIAAAISARGAARDLLRQGFRGGIELFISPLVLEESERNIRLKAPETLADYRIFQEALVAQLVEPPEDLIRATAEFIDSKDAPIVAAAIEAQVTYLATYDRKHLLSKRQEIEGHFAIIVATPDEILRASVFDEIQARNPDVTPEEAEEDAAREIAAHRREKNERSKPDDIK